jgi:hypothetical protein
VDGFLPLVGALHFYNINGMKEEFPRFIEDYIPYLYEINGNIANYVRVIADLTI